MEKHPLEAAVPQTDREEELVCYYSWEGVVAHFQLTGHSLEQRQGQGEGQD